MTSTTQAAADRAARRRPGVVVGVLTGGLRELAAAGTARPDSLFEIGSVTKVFTATVLADEVVRGNLALDQPLRDLLPEAPAAITLRHLATHTSGLRRVPLSGVRPWLEFFRGHDPYASVTPETLRRTLGAAKLKRAPGTGKLAYSNFGYAALGVALVQATGHTDYEAMVVDRICHPLGLTDTAVHVDPERLLPGHRGKNKPADPWLLTGVAGAGALRSSASDLLTFLAAQLDPDSTPIADAIRLTQQEHASGIGLGWMRKAKPHQLLWHNGGTGGYRSFAGFLPDRGVAVAALANSTRSVDLTGLNLLRELAPAR